MVSPTVVDVVAGIVVVVGGGALPAVQPAKASEAKPRMALPRIADRRAAPTDVFTEAGRLAAKGICHFNVSWPGSRFRHAAIMQSSARPRLKPCPPAPRFASYRVLIRMR